MTLIERIASPWLAVLDTSAQAAASLASRLSTRQNLSVTVGAANELIVYNAGRTEGLPLGRIVLGEQGAPSPTARMLRRSHVTLDLDPARFLFRTVDLPGQAADYVEAIVRTQIDRLTPWRPDQVVFGWTSPVRNGETGGISVTVAATSREMTVPLVERIQALGAAVVVARVALSAALLPPDAVSERTVIIARSSAAAFAVAFWRRILGIATAVVVVLVIGSSLYAQVASYQLALETDDLARVGAAKRSMVARGTDANNPAIAARRFVEHRKTEVPFAALVLETVSRTLPDDTFLTSLELTGTRLRLVGFAKDAPGLISLLDASGGLSGATFFAPTTRLPEDPGDRFNIEATVRPDLLAR